MKPKFFKYTLTEEFSINDLHTKFSNHRRLTVFAQKGCACVTCGKVGTRLIKGIDGGGRVHIDLYTDDLLPITVDHIIPKSLGGLNHIDNYQPMCFPCNNKKGNGKRNHNPSRVQKVDMNNFTQVSHTISGTLIGKCIYKIHKYSSIPRNLGTVDAIGTNPHSNNIAAIVFKGVKTSYYDLGKSLYVENQLQAVS
jgi:hypothetical protein